MEPITWAELNSQLRKLKTEAQVQALFDKEKRGEGRPRWLKRIYSRYSKLRRRRERKEWA